MARSILTDDLTHCFICGHDNAHVHHVFYGRNRRNADEDGLTIGLCYRHHNGSDEGIHFCHQLDTQIKMMAQKKYEESHTRDEFIRRYGKSYI